MYERQIFICGVDPKIHLIRSRLVIDLGTCLGRSADHEYRLLDGRTWVWL